tara:strand:- start:86 stop:415 length:330 start_codon:yes stop_codon:yes gene_type:complete
MNIDNLIEEYKKQAKICTESDYLNRNSVRKNNKAVDRMYEIVKEISENYSSSYISRFSELLNNIENRTHIWSAVHLLEKLTIDKQTETKALKIIEEESESDSASELGFQ